jgi:hypothetical protein
MLQTSIQQVIEMHPSTFKGALGSRSWHLAASIVVHDPLTI